MKQRGKRVAMVIFSILPLLMVLSVYSRLPEQVPLQWNGGGVSRYGAKWELFPLAGMNLLFGILMPLFAKIDPKRKNYERFEKTYDWLILGLMGFLTVLMGLTLVESLYPNTMNIPKVVCCMMAILFIFIGNMMPKVKQNYFTGTLVPEQCGGLEQNPAIGGQSLFLWGHSDADCCLCRKERIPEGCCDCSGGLCLHCTHGHVLHLVSAGSKKRRGIKCKNVDGTGRGRYTIFV